MSITILNPGMLTSVQDLGRIGYQQERRGRCRCSDRRALR